MPQRGRGSPRALRLGIVGCGRVTSSLHVPALAPLRDIRVAALADTNAGALARVAGQVRPERTASHYRELVDDPTLDAIAVCVPARSHAEIALAAIEAGKHVFVEKPLALTLADCDALAARAAKAGVCAMVGFNTRWHAQARRARDAIRRGELGAIDAIASRLTSCHDAVPDWQKARATGGGVMLELAIHHVDLWRCLTGAEIDEVSAFARSGEREDETATLVARLSDGSLATAVFAERTSRANEVDVWGRSGSIALSLYRFDGYATADAASVAGDGRARLRSAMRFARALPRAVLDARRGGAWPLTYRDTWRHFAAAIRGRVPVESTLDDGRRALAVVLAAIESAATGRSVKVARS
ncbi:myo-inositol 2-dehydrogenase / D-chiro-inositol 1-dehydrogenase [Burkholderiales bacterium]|nr:myo-inositol 2-dehydrogenase / D-chiro-inositol 1-dehydrogenase [Burkholderiales bacterium]